MLALSDKTFEKYRKDEMPTLVMFHAVFSGPCELAKEPFINASRRAGNRIRFATFDLDGNVKTPEKYGVKGIPMFVLFKDGKPKNPVVGALNEEQILEIIDYE